MKKVNVVLSGSNIAGSEVHALELFNHNKSKQGRFFLLKPGPLEELINKMGVGYCCIHGGFFYKIIYLAMYGRKKYSFSLHQPTAQVVGFFLAALGYSTFNTYHVSSRQYLLEKKYIKWLMYKITLFLCQSISKSDIFVSYDVLRVDSIYKKKSCIIKNWVRKDLFTKLNLMQEKHTLYFPKSTLKILTVGSLSESKGHTLLVDCLSKLNNIDFEWTIVGDGPQKGKLEELCKDRLRFGQYKFAGEQTDISNFYLDADIFILLSKIETFGLVYAEAMLASLPIVALDTCVSREVIPPDNAFVSLDGKDFQNRFYNLLQNELPKIGASNKEYAIEHYSEKNLNSYYEIFDK